MGKFIHPYATNRVQSGRKTFLTSPAIKTGISKNNEWPLSQLLIFQKYGFTHYWTAENITDGGATLTAHDYAGTYDLANPGGGITAPTINTSDANFAGKQTLSFNGSSDGLKNSVTNFRSGDTEGMITVVLNPVATKSTFAFCSCDELTANQYWGMMNFASNDFYRQNPGGTLNRVANSANSNINEYGPTIITYTVDTIGGLDQCWVNGIEISLNTISGSFGQWLNTVAGRDNITIGYAQRSTGSNYGTLDWAVTGYHSSILAGSLIVQMHQDYMSYYRLDIPLMFSKINQLGGILNAWNYEFIYESGTTTTVFDLKGEYDMSNPGASNQPTLTANSLDFDGTDDYLYNSVSDYLSGKSTGVIHVFSDIPSSDFGFPFASCDEASSDYVIAVGSTNTASERGLVRIAGTPTSLITTETYSGFKVISLVQDGVSAYLLIDGVKITDYSTQTLTTEWFNSVANRDNISIGALIRSSPYYSPDKWKAAIITDYVSEALAISVANQILYSGL